MLELYSDYIISSFGKITATGLAEVLDETISHDKTTRWLGERDLSSKDWWLLIKPIVRECESENGVVIIDDTVEEKAYTHENDLICWHYDHAKNRPVKGVNCMTALYHGKDEINIPLDFYFIHKTEGVMDEKTGKPKRISKVKKSEVFRAQLMQIKQNEVKFKYVLSDSFFASIENMEFIVKKLGKDFVMAIKGNRNVALSYENKLNGKWEKVDELGLKPAEAVICYLPGLGFPVKLATQTFENKDGSVGARHLITSNLDLSWEEIIEIYSKRWKVEEYHKSIKSNCAYSGSPTKKERTQQNHFFASIYAFLKLELLRLKRKLNHFALRSKLHLKALQISYQEFQNLKNSVSLIPAA